MRSGFRPIGIHRVSRHGFLDEIRVRAVPTLRATDLIGRVVLLGESS
jgi:hypothetical protein